MITEIRVRFMAGFYTAATIAFDGEEAFERESFKPEDATEEQLAPMMLGAMRVALPGRKLPLRFDVEPEHWL